MSYTYLQEQGEESSAENFSDIPPYALLKLNLTAERFCCNGSETECCQGSQSGTMSEPSTVDRGGEKLISCVEGSHARTLVLQEKEQGSQETEVGCGLKWQESFAKWDRNTLSWKTHQCSLLEGLESFLGTWPKWGVMRDGACWELPTSGRRTEENECGYWPTLVKFDAQACHPYIAEIQNENRLFTISSNGIRATSPLVAWLAGLPNKKVEGKAAWRSEPDLGRVVYGVADGMDRIGALGNGQVPAVAALAFRHLSQALQA
jgi:hypothetical protein